MKRILPALASLVVVAAACSDTAETSPANGLASPSTSSAAGEVPAPEFPDGLDWINVDRPLSIAELMDRYPNEFAP